MSQAELSDRYRRLRGGYDLHLHVSPDVVPRAQDIVELARDAQRAGMAGIGLKDHTTSTVGRCHALNRLMPEGPRFFSSLVLNPPVGSLNPTAVEAALRAGADIIYFPTYGARHHIQILGIGAPPGNLPVPSKDFPGVTIWEDDGRMADETLAILDLIATHDAVLATGHISPEESLALLETAGHRGVRRMVVTHASEIVPGMTIDHQRVAVQLGAKIEHCFLAATACCPGTIPLATIAEQIQAVGSEHIILSSDFGQVANGPPIAALAEHVQRLIELGVDESQMRMMICENPAELMKGKL